MFLSNLLSSDLSYLIFTNYFILISAIVEDRNPSGIQRTSSLKQYQIMRLTLTVMTILLEKLYMMKNISKSVSREGSFLVALKEMKNISGMKIMLKMKKKKMMMMKIP